MARKPRPKKKSHLELGNHFKLGTYLTTKGRPVDMIPFLVAQLRAWNKSKADALYDTIPQNAINSKGEGEWWYSQEAEDLKQNLVIALNAELPDGYRFGIKDDGEPDNWGIWEETKTQKTTEW